MKQILISIALLCFTLITKVHAQTAASGNTGKITELLAHFPAGDSAAFEMKMKAIDELGEKGLEEMSTLFADPGKGDNTALEYALSGFSAYATKPGNKTIKDKCATAYIYALEKVTAPENKAFLIRQLQVVGNDKAAAALKKYITDERLCDPAARALVKIKTPLAHTILLGALTNATGNTKLTLTSALADSRYRESVPVITAFAGSTDTKLHKVALYALAHIADPASALLLSNAAAKAGYSYDASGATADYLHYAKQLANDGKSVQSLKIATALLKKTTLDKQVQTRTAALKIIVDIQGEKATPLLISCMNDPNLQYREAALKFAGAFKTDAAIAQWTTQLPKSTDVVKAEIITMLGKTGNISALPALQQALQDNDSAVKISAIKASAAVGGQKALPALLNVMKNGKPEEVVAVSNAILIMKGTEVTHTVSEALPGTTNPVAKAALINLLSARADDASLSQVIELTHAGDTTVKHAAFGALKNMVKKENLQQLYILLGHTQNETDIKATQQAIVAATGSVTDTTARTSLILAQMMQTPPEKKCLYFGVLSAIGGNTALWKVKDGFTNGNEQTKISAINALANWTDGAAALSLLQIARQSADSSYADAALMGYIHTASTQPYPDDQELLMLRNAMPLTKTTAQKQLIIREAGKCKTYLALLFAGDYLDDPALRHDAAYSVMEIALAGKNMYGETVRKLLEKSTDLLNGQDAAYEKQAIRKRLSEFPSGEGFVPLFNKKDLTGWKGLVENPLQRAKMNPDTLARKQLLADERMRKGWFAKDGELIFGGNGDNLCTIKKYGDFEMFADWKITKDGDAGIYLRGSPQVQIWDTSRLDVGAQVGSGGLYNNTTNPSKPLKMADNGIGEWNSFHIIMKGDRVTVYLNGELVVDNIMLENYWDRNLPIFPEEQIELQAHGTYVAYRDLYIREMPAAKPFVLSGEEKKDSFKLLFDGTNMHEWTGNTTDYILDDGNIAIYPKNGGHGNLYTKEEYSDFVYRFEFQLTPGANNGIGIRAPLEGDAAYVGMEIQVLDNEADIYKNLHPYQYHGSVYGVIPAKRGFLKPVGEWNTEEIEAKGSHIKVTLNGTVILDGDIEEASRNGTADGKQHPGLKRTKGHIGFLGHGDIVKFRNVRVKNLE